MSDIETKTSVAIIGAGGMGRLYGAALRKQNKISYYDPAVGASDLEGAGLSMPEVLKGASYVILSIPASSYEACLKEIAPELPKGATLIGQCATKEYEEEVLLKYLPRETPIVLCHSLHGPSINPSGQNMLLVPVRGSKKEVDGAIELLKQLGSHITTLESSKIHDQLMADVQVVTHLGFQCMGSAWKELNVHPEKSPHFESAIDEVKFSMALRICAGRPHVYSDLAMKNKRARVLAGLYADSAAELLDRLYNASVPSLRGVLADLSSGFNKQKQILGGWFESQARSVYGSTRPNTQMSLLAMAQVWKQTGVDPYQNPVFHTPPFRIRLGVVEAVLQNPETLLEEILLARSDEQSIENDRVFVKSVKKWSEILVSEKEKEYFKEFEELKSFFAESVPDAIQKSNRIIKALD